MVFLALLAAAVAAPSPAPASDGDRLFAAASAVLRAQAYPRYASYAVRVSFHNVTRTGTYRVTDTWQTTENLTNATVLARIFSNEDADDPHVPHGINIGLPLLGNLNREQPHDPIGQVAFAIDQTFGVAPQRTYAVANDVSDFARDASGFALIGATGAIARRYKVDLLGTAEVDDAPSLHLGLTPLFNPKRDRLRELWIAPGTMNLQAAVVAGIGNRAPTTQVAWKVAFAIRDGATYVASETALAPLDYGGAGTLHDVTIAFDDLTTSATLPFRYTFGLSTPTQPLADP